MRVFNLVRYCDLCHLKLGEREMAVICGELLYHERCAPKEVSDEETECC